MLHFIEDFNGVAYDGRIIRARHSEKELENRGVGVEMGYYDREAIERTITEAEKTLFDVEITQKWGMEPLRDEGIRSGSSGGAPRGVRETQRGPPLLYIPPITLAKPHSPTSTPKTVIIITPTLETSVVALPTVGLASILCLAPTFVIPYLAIFLSLILHSGP